MAFGAPFASMSANTWPEPGVALKPPVPQPQLKNRPCTGRLGNDRAGVGRDVDDAAPLAVHAYPRELRKQLDDGGGRVFDHVRILPRWP
jgi:hypothetical protein